MFSNWCKSDHSALRCRATCRACSHKCAAFWGQIAPTPRSALHSRATSSHLSDPCPAAQQFVRQVLLQRKAPCDAGQEAGIVISACDLQHSMRAAA